MTWKYEPHLQELRGELEEVKLRIKISVALIQSKDNPPIISATREMMLEKFRILVQLRNVLERQIEMAEAKKRECNVNT